MYKGREVFLWLLPGLFGKLISLYSFLFDCKLGKVDTAISENSLLVGFCQQNYRLSLFQENWLVCRQDKCRVLLEKYNVVFRAYAKSEYQASL